VTSLTAALIGLGTILTAATLVWMISVRLRDASIADICWGLGFVLLAWLYRFLSPASTLRDWLVPALMTLWGARLSAHIFRRNHGQGEDPRYQAMRASHGRAFWWRSLFAVFWLQGAILWFVALPFLAAMRATAPVTLTAVDGLGVLLFTSGFGFEVIGDYQLRLFRAEPGNRGKVLDSGLWLHASSELLRRRHDVVGHVCHGGINTERMAHRVEPVPHDVVAAARIRDHATRGRPESLEARLLRLHHPHVGVLSLVSARTEMSLCKA
jgi:hypothetical protein